jgi:type I restriction enzyme S subunit
VLDVQKDDIPRIPHRCREDFNGALLQDGDVIIADTAEDETTGKACEIGNLQGSAIVSGLHTMVCRPRNRMALGYLGYYLNSNAYHHQLLPLMQGIKVLSLSRSNIQKTSVSYPSAMKEQQLIASYFSQLDHLITLHQRKFEKLTNVKKSMLEKMFPQNGSSYPEIRFKGFTDPWEQRKLGDIGETYTGLSGKTKADFGHGQARFVTYMNVFSNPISNPEMTEPIEIDPKQNEVEVGDVLFTTSSETPEEVGMSSVLLEKRGKTYLNSFCFGFRPSEKIDSYYLAYMLRSESAREKIILLAQGISRYNISKNKVMEIAVSLPSLDEQKLIGQYFRQLDHLITLHQRELEKLQNIKKSMLEKMFV